ncbi:hypothetical protein J2T58_001803 [Methanocalculus alkaliphilus]|uniref:hypothetical protein n=1 Tax=Methanocalculus alkaliphilus TaxID=768730 RepID=UPI00209FFBAA|nr:hypothetical protein [Methanocalculus alkaliphilus]MCP1715929.1 hypothetical protein [Methanocalculus alkaliphilus]
MERNDIPRNTPGPETLADIAGIMVEGMVRNLKRTIPLFIGIFIGIYILHTFVLFYINQSIRGRGDLLGNMLAVTDGLITGTLFWLLIAMLGTTVFLKIRQHGVDGYIREIKEVPEWISQSRSLYEAESTALLAAGIGIGGLIGAIFQNYLVSILIAILLLLSFTAREESVLLLVSGVGYSDLKRIFLNEPAFSPLEIERTTLVITGCSAGFLLAAFIPRIGSLIIAIAALGYALYWYHMQKGSGRSPEAATALTGILVLMAASLLTTPVLAAVGGMPISSSCSCPYNNTGTALIVGIFPASATIAGILSTLTISGGASSLAGITAGMGSSGAGAAGTSAAGASPGRPDSGIYGTGTPDDPFRDAGSIGKTEADGSLTQYPEQVGRPPEIIGRGTPDDPYRDNPEYRRYREQSGDQGGAAPKQELPDTTPEAPVAPEMPEPEAPGEPIPEREPPKTPETPPTPEHPQPEPEGPVEPEMPQEPKQEVEPPRIPKAPIMSDPPAAPEAPTQPGEETMPEWRIQQLRDHISELETREQEIRSTWQERREIQADYERAQREYKRQGVRTMFKMGKETWDAVTDPKQTIYDGVKEKLEIETPLDEAKEELFGREVTTKELTSEWQEIQTRRRELRSRLDSMPSKEEMLEETREIKRKIRDTQQQIERGVW